MHAHETTRLGHKFGWHNFFFSSRDLGVNSGQRIPSVDDDTEAWQIVFCVAGIGHLPVAHLIVYCGRGYEEDGLLELLPLLIPELSSCLLRHYLDEEPASLRELASRRNGIEPSPH
jgi:hypothetical protein